MNKRAVSELLTSDVVFLLLLLVVFSGVLYYVTGFEDGAALQEDFYAKELAKIINSAGPGTEVVLDVSRATEIAFNRGKKDFDSLFSFDEKNGEIKVSLRLNGGTTFPYFTDVKIEDVEVKELSGGFDEKGNGINQLFFKIVKREEALGE